MSYQIAGYAVKVGLVLVDALMDLLLTRLYVA